MKTSSLFLLFVFFWGTRAFSAHEYYDLSKSIRSQGMGGAFLGLSDDEYALFSNPAGLSLRRTGNELMVRVNGHLSSDLVESGFKFPTTLEDYLEKRQQLNGNAGLLPYFVSKNLAVGLLIADTKANLSPSPVLLDILGQLAISGDVKKAVNQIKSQFGPTSSIADLTFISDSGIVVGYAQEVGDPNLHLGVNLKGILRSGGRKLFTAQEYINKNQQIDWEPERIGGSGVGFDLDLGATYEMKELPFGLISRASLVFSNLLATEFSISRKYRAVPGLVRTANLGWYTVFDGFAFVDNVHALVDISNISLGGESNPDLGARTGSFLKKLHVGVELPIGLFSLRAGLNQGYLAAGFGLNFWALRLDAATYAEEIGETNRQPSRRYALTVAIGVGNAPPAPIPATPRERKLAPAQEVPKAAPTETWKPALQENSETSKAAEESNEAKEQKN